MNIHPDNEQQPERQEEPLHGSPRLVFATTDLSEFKANADPALAAAIFANCDHKIALKLAD